MNKLFKSVSFKFLAVFIILFISSVSVFAADKNSALTNQPLAGLEAFLSFSFLLFVILAPAFKRRERRTFLNGNNEFFSI